MLCFAGATMPYCLSLLSAMTVIGTVIFNFSFRSSCPKTARICSIRNATSRPRLSPASVITEKCAVCTSIHFGSSLALGNAKFGATSIASRIATAVANFMISGCRRLLMKGLEAQANASTPASEQVTTTTAQKQNRNDGETDALARRLSSWPQRREHVTLSSVTSAPSSRLAWIDWMRGLACLLMFQTHCYDAWLGGEARNTRFLKGSQLLGTLPAPLFLFLAGVSFALVTDKLIRKNLSPAEITRALLRRGAEIFAFGLLFRLQEFLIAWGWAPWSDLLRVDVLNIIGLSMMLMGIVCWLVLGFKRGQTRRTALVLA